MALCAAVSAQACCAALAQPVLEQPCALPATPPTPLQDKEGGGKGELFDGDGLPSKPSASGSKVYAGGARSGKLKVPECLQDARELGVSVGCAAACFCSRPPAPAASVCHIHRRTCLLAPPPTLCRCLLRRAG